MRTIVVLDAPSNLGLRPPAPGTVPGCYKLAGALREQRVLARLGALEGGVVVPPRYDRGDWKAGDGVFNAAAIARYTRTLADRIEGHVRAGSSPWSSAATAPSSSARPSPCAASGGTGSPPSTVPPTSGTPATARGSARRAARNWPSPPAGARRTSATSKGSAPTSGTRTYASSACGTRTRTRWNSPRSRSPTRPSARSGSGAPPTSRAPRWRAWRRPLSTGTGSTWTPTSSTRA